MTCGLAAMTLRTKAALASEEFPEVTNVLQVARLSSQNPSISYSIRLEGNAWWADPTQGKLVLQDESGAEELEMDLRGQSLRAGERVRLDGRGTIAKTGGGFRIGALGPVVDNDGVHSIIEKSGAIYLKAGRHPLRLDWFNGVEGYGLEVNYQGPGLPKQRIANSALFRSQTNEAGGIEWTNGLEFRCYEGAWELLPDFRKLAPVKAGSVSNFDLGVLTRGERVGAQFAGWLDAPADGLYTFYVRSDDGSQLFIEGSPLRLATIGRAVFPQPRAIAPGEALRADENCLWAQVEGTVSFVSEQADALELELSSGTGRMSLQLPHGSRLSPALLLNQRIRAAGVCRATHSADGRELAGLLLVPGTNEIKRLEEPPHRVETNPGRETLPVLTSAVEVHRLKREEAQRGYPVKLRGVITCVLPEHQAFTIQDSTRGLYVVDFSSSRSTQPRIGEFLELEGTTDPSLFAPIVNARRVSSLGAGHLPEPARATWDQLLNGSLDAQYVELQGILAAVHTNGVTLLTRDGRIKVELRLTGGDAKSLERFEDALVRVRGCLFANWDYVTHQVKVGEIRVYGANVSMDQPAPEDLFSIPKKTAAELLLFDPQAGVFQRVKVSGQIVHARGAECYLMDGQNGLRFIAKKPAQLEPGDRVEVVGFPELSGASPVLLEAVARKISHGALPPARILPPGNLLRADYDATRVRVEGLLAGMRETADDQLLEMQSGVRTFVARLGAKNPSMRSLPIGSRLELDGVYAAQGSRLAGQDITSFELLLNSADDIKVLARPPWWTLERLLIVVGALAFVLAITVLWITQLHRQVESRSAELETQIQERQRAEHQRAMEQERARIAQDLHDELGSGLTEISMLGARARSASSADGQRSRHLEHMSDKARELVMALDEIVWAMNPRHDSLASLISYFCLYADRFLGLANIAWKLESSSEPPDRAVNSRHRHQLFLAFKEALTNIVRHSNATEVRLAIQLEAERVRLSVADNGRGLSSAARTEDMDGVANMRERIEKLGGRFEMSSRPGQGTVIEFYVPAG